LGCAGGDFTECSPLALSIQDLDQKLMHLLMEINVVMLFPSRSVSIFGQDQCFDRSKQAVFIAYRFQNSWKYKDEWFHFCDTSRKKQYEIND